MKEKRIGYIDLLREEIPLLKNFNLTDKDGMELISFITKKEVNDVIKECKIITKRTPKVYELILREIE